MQRHTDGVVSVTYKEAEQADLCVSSLHQRWFAKRRILAATWDGQSKYEVEETEKEREERLKKWENFLETGQKDGHATLSGIDIPNATNMRKSETALDPNTVEKYANSKEIEPKNPVTENDSNDNVSSKVRDNVQNESETMVLNSADKDDKENGSISKES